MIEEFTPSNVATWLGTHAFSDASSLRLEAPAYTREASSEVLAFGLCSHLPAMEGRFKVSDVNQTLFLVR